MELLFSDFGSTPQEHTAKELKRYKCEGGCPSPNPSPRKKGIIWGVFIEQLINASIVGGIAGLAAFSAGADVGLKTAIIAFGMTFLLELRKYRKI